MAGREVGVAIEIPEPYGAELHRLREKLGDPTAWAMTPHVTLLPPTVLPEPDLDPALAHLRAVAEGHRPFQVRLEGAGTFRPVSPVVFVQLRRGMAECAVLERSVRSGVLHRETAFAYYPHVTVAHDLSEVDLDTAEHTAADYRAEFTVTGFALFERASDGCWRPLQEFTFPITG